MTSFSVVGEACLPSKQQLSDVFREKDKVSTFVCCSLWDNNNFGAPILQNLAPCVISLRLTDSVSLMILLLLCEQCEVRSCGVALYRAHILCFPDIARRCNEEDWAGEGGGKPNCMVEASMHKNFMQCIESQCCRLLDCPMACTCCVPYVVLHAATGDLHNKQVLTVM